MKEKIILKCKLSPGDTLTLTATVESLMSMYPDTFEVDVRSPTPAIWENNPHLTKIDDNEGRLIELEYPLIHKSNQILTPFLNGYLYDVGEKLGIPLKLTVNRPYLYLSDQEKSWISQVQEIVQKPTKYWIINAGIKDDYTCKQWPVEYYQEVVNKTCGLIQWVQIGAKEHNHPNLKGVIDLRGQTNTRQLIRLVYNSEGGLGPSTFLQHLMAAFEKPYLCLLGGREPIGWVQYPKQITFHTIGMLSCCKNHACWKSKVLSDCLFPILGLERPVSKCMAMISAEEVVTILKKYSHV